MTYKTIQEVKAKMRKEGDLYLFTHLGLQCVIVRVDGHLNGYVALPEGHPLRDKECMQKIDYINNIDIHGGLTFFGELTNIRIEGVDLSWCFGFDTTHCFDFYIRDWGNKEIQSMYNDMFLKGIDKYRDMEYVISETKSLAEQLQNFSL